MNSLFKILMMFISFICPAVDGIRYRNVTGVQTCALPILMNEVEFHPEYIIFILVSLCVFASIIRTILILWEKKQGWFAYLPVIKIGRASGRKEGRLRGSGHSRKENTRIEETIEETT